MNEIKLSNHINNKKCYNRTITAQPEPESPWVTCEDGNDGEKDHYRDVWVDGILAYCFGETCIILGIDNSNNTVTLENNEQQIFSIPYEQYVKDFGLNLQ